MIFSRHVGAFVSKQQKNLHFFTKRSCKEVLNAYNTPHTTTRCCEALTKPVRRCFLLFNNVSDNLCGHLLIDLF